MTIATGGLLTAGTMSKRKSYDVSFKLKAVKCTEKKSKEAAAREIRVETLTGSHAALRGQRQCHKRRFYIGIRARYQSKMVI